MVKKTDTLLLFPTELEQHRFRDQGGLEGADAHEEIAGFGAIAAGARTMQLLARLEPRRVLLVGIAGAYDIEAHALGTALTFSRVAVDGIGAGEGERFHGPVRLGFPQWPGDVEDGSEAIEDVLPLATAGETDGLLLTTCAASDSSSHAAERRRRHPEAIAEDMEGFSVALACSLARVPLAIVRGVSNLVGERDPKRWCIPAALAAARRSALDVLDADWSTAR